MAKKKARGPAQDPLSQTYEHVMIPQAMTPAAGTGTTGSVLAGIGPS